jgi:hypothetical protein
VWHVEAVNERVEYGPPRATVPALVVIAALVVAFAIGAGTSQRYAGGAATALLLIAAAWVAFGPAVVADHDGVTVRGLIGRRHVTWAEVIRLRHDDRRRSHTLELEVADGLIVIPSYLLGRTPLAVAERELSALRNSWGPTDPVT